MPDIRDLLEQAAADVTVTESNPVRRIEAARRRRERRWIVSALATMAVVGLAIVIPIATSHDHGGARVNASRPSASPSVSPSPYQSPDAMFFAHGDGSVTYGFGSLWSAKCCGGTTGSTYVDRLSPDSGDREARISLPGPVVQVDAGDDRVWTIGATDGGPSQINAINPVDGSVASLHISSPALGPLRVVVADGSAWVTFGSVDQVWRLTAGVSGITRFVIHVPGGPQDLVATGDGTIWVSNDYGAGNRIWPITPTATGAVLGRSRPWNQPLLGEDFGNFVWTADCCTVRPVDIRTGQATLVDLGRRLPKGAAPVSVVTSQGLTYVTTDVGLLVYEPDGGPVTSRLDPAPASYFDPDIGIAGVVPLGDRVVFSDQYGLVSWKP